MNDTLEARRAIFVYEAARLHASASNAPVVPKPWGAREVAFRRQFLEVIKKQCGPERSNSPEQLHQDWVDAYIKMGWLYGKHYNPELKTHPDMVPYDKLGELEKAKDTVFILLCDIAREWIKE